MTQENEEAIAIKKQKEAEAKAKAIADAKAKAEADRLAKEKAEQEAKKKKLDALIGGVSKSEGVDTGSEGNDNKAVTKDNWMVIRMRQVILVIWWCRKWWCWLWFKW